MTVVDIVCVLMGAVMWDIEFRQDTNKFQVPVTTLFMIVFFVIVRPF